LPEDRIGGQPVADVQLFDTYALTDMKATARQFTWKYRHVWSKIDRAICNDKWIINYGNDITTQFKENFFSDHSRTYPYKNHR